MHQVSQQQNEAQKEEFIRTSVNNQCRELRLLMEGSDWLELQPGLEKLKERLKTNPNLPNSHCILRRKVEGFYGSGDGKTEPVKASYIKLAPLAHYNAIKRYLNSNFTVSASNGYSKTEAPDLSGEFPRLASIEGENHLHGYDIHAKFEVKKIEQSKKPSNGAPQ